MGYLARGQQVPGVPAAAPSETARPRQVVLHVHLSDESIRHSGLASVEEGRLAVPVDRLAEWLGVPDARLSVRPVIDLSEPLVSDAYAAPGRLAEQVVLRDPGCVFPWCNVAARRCDLDHVDAWEVGGATASGNLAPLCRRHHRHKTHAGWTYEVISPGTYLWTSPHGLRFLRDRHATVQLA